MLVLVHFRSWDKAEQVGGSFNLAAVLFLLSTANAGWCA
jgi:hypothetical protein